MQGKTVLITGATGGIGLATAKGLAARGADLILGCRNMEKAEAARAAIVRQTPGASVDIRPLNLAAFSSIRAFAEDVLAGPARLDVLINNAATMPMSYEMTEDGFEAMIGVNFLGHFLLTNLLMDRLKDSAPARIVHVSSVMHRRGRIDFKSFKTRPRRYRWAPFYAQSKLANMLFAFELARRLDGTGVTSNALHPGIVATDIVRGMPGFMQAGMKLIAKTPAQGAATSIRLAADPALAQTTGRYFVDEKPARPAARAENQALAREVWAHAEILTGLAPGDGQC